MWTGEVWPQWLDMTCRGELVCVCACVRACVCPLIPSAFLCPYSTEEGRRVVEVINDR